jgi:hypothetical protein
MATWYGRILEPSLRAPAGAQPGAHIMVTRC